MSESIIWWFVLGALTWAVSVVVKLVLSGALHIATTKRLSPKWYAMVQGALSAVTELGAAALVFLYLLPEGSLSLVLAFGAGAGIVEALILFGVGLFEKTKAQETVADKSTSALPWYQEWTFVVERFGALLGHVGSRGLVWFAVHSPLSAALPAIFALISFSAVDGVATYGTLKKWNWLEPRIWKRFYSFATLVGALEVALFFGLYFFVGL